MTSTPRNPGWTIQLNVHRAVRRDVARLAEAMAEGRGTSPTAVATYWAETSAHLHHHHEFEDTVVLPLMNARLGTRVESLLERNAQEHVVMAAAMDTFDAALVGPAFDVAAAREALARLAEAIETHLAHEEADLLPLIPEAFTADDLAYFKAESAKGSPAPAFLPWVLDDAPEADLAFFTADMPAPVREQLEAAWMPQRRLAVEGLLGARPVAGAATVSGATGALV